MRIVHVVPLVSPRAEYGGPARGALRHAAYAAAHGEQAEVLSLWPRDAGPPPERMAGVRLRLFRVSFRLPGHPFVGLWSFGAARWLRRSAATADVVHLHSGRELWMIFCALVLRRRGVPYVWQSHGMLAPSPRVWARILDKTVLPVVLRGAVTVLYLTPREERELRSSYGLGNLTLLINGVDDVADPGSVRVRPAGAPLRLVVTSRLQRRKRIPELVAAVADCRRAGVDARLMIFGPDEGDLAATRAAIAAAPPGGQIGYGGPLAYEQVRDVLAGHDVIALASVDEPFPYSVLEGMARGLVPLVSRSCGLAPYLDDADAGVIVSDDDPESLRHAITALAADPSRVADLQRRTLALTRTTFSLMSVAERLLGIYRAAVAERTPVVAP